MDKKIKLIWDFHGPDSEQIAKHQCIHLKEFAEKEKLAIKESGFENLEKNYWIAFLLVTESEMIKVRDALRPNRGQLV